MDLRLTIMCERILDCLVKLSVKFSWVQCSVGYVPCLRFRVDVTVNRGLRGRLLLKDRRVSCTERRLSVNNLLFLFSFMESLYLVFSLHKTWTLTVNVLFTIGPFS